MVIKIIFRDEWRTYSDVYDLVTLLMGELRQSLVGRTDPLISRHSLLRITCLFKYLRAHNIFYVTAVGHKLVIRTGNLNVISGEVFRSNI